MDCGCCLRIVNNNDPIPLKSIDVVVRIKGFVADVESTLCFKNIESNPIEAMYEFPMDDQSAVYRFEAKIEDRTIIAECQEKKQAKETYDEAIKQGYSATLMEEDDASSDIFRCLVGNLPPNTETQIIFAYVTELNLLPDGKLKFLLPTLLNPRYNPSAAAGGSANPPTVKYVPTTDGQPYTFTFKAVIANAEKLVPVTSDKDELSVTFDDTRKETLITMVKPFIADHDLELNVTYDQPCQPKVVVEKGQPGKDGILKQDVVMLNFFPDLQESDYSNKHEFIFVIDRSGSMQGERIMDAKESLLLFLKSLPSGCYFNIVGFGSTFEVLFKEGSREYSEDSLKVACEHQKNLEADLGGTEILQPLQDIYSKPPMKTHSRQILLLTDGEVFNTQAVIGIVKKNALNTRVFAFGIGEGASTSLIKGVARAGRGKAEFVKSGERMHPLVMKILKAAMQISVTDISLDYQLSGSPKFTQVPRQMPPIFAGDRLISYAIFSESAALVGTANLKGKIGDRTLDFSLSLDTSNEIWSSDDSLSIHRLAAKSEIKQLQDNEKENSEEKEKNNETKAAIILLSTAVNVVSNHTSMVGVDKDCKEVVTGSMVQRKVPMMQDQTLCYGGMMPMRAMACCSAMPKLQSRSYAMAPGMMDCAMGGPPPPPPGNRVVLRGGCGPPPTSALGVYDDDDDTSSEASREEEEIKKPKLETDYMALISFQTFSGSWKLTEEFSKELLLDLNEIKKSAPIKTEDIWATILALACLQVKFADKRDEWEMIEMKAKQWLTGRDLKGKSFDELLEKAKSVISSK